MKLQSIQLLITALGCFPMSKFTALSLTLLGVRKSQTTIDKEFSNTSLIAS